MTSFAFGEHVRYIVTVDWEGNHLRPENLQAMREFRERHPDIPMLHFLNAAYYTQSGANADEVTEKTRSVMLPFDEAGVHVHGWRSLVEAAGVKFRNGPFWWYEKPNHAKDLGHTISISEYTVEELTKIFDYSREKLKEQGFSELTSFRSGGWQGAPNVMEALARAGMKFDSSATPTYLLASRLSHTKLYDSASQLWRNVGDTTQPWKMETPSGNIVETPNNGGLADYVGAGQMEQIFKRNAKNARPGWGKPNSTQYIVVGFHQETADYYLPRFERGMARIARSARWRKVSWQPVPLPLATFCPFASLTSAQ